MDTQRANAKDMLATLFMVKSDPSDSSMKAITNCVINSKLNG